MLRPACLVSRPFAILQHKPEAPAKLLRWRFRLVLPIRARSFSVLGMQLAWNFDDGDLR